MAEKVRLGCRRGGAATAAGRSCSIQRRLESRDAARSRTYARHVVDCRRRIADVELFMLRVCRCDSDEVDGPLWSRVNDVRAPGAGGGRAQYF